jgi:uncharacterized protein (DUF2235 family)
VAKNILIFSDGTGQAGGLRPDQRLSNVYKLYRATRIGPDSPIDPIEQIAFYETGLGSAEIEGPAWLRPMTFLRKLLSSGLGTGFMSNVADCYEAILKVYEPGDRVYLFGFSRGAYTVRSVAGVMNLCGVPVQYREGNPIPRQGKALRRIVDEAVRTVYEHGAGHARGKYEAEREEQARRFREAYNTQDDPVANERGNVVPYFVGVFDTVGALGATGLARFAINAGAAIIGLALAAGAAGLLNLIFGLGMLPATGIVFLGLALAFAFVSFRSRIRTIRDFPNKGDFSWHRAAWRFQHYDRYLDPRIRYARHAQAIDETRASFARVGWGRKDDMDETPDDWLVQKWFAGNHSNIGGSYPETESRLSDIALEWMVEQATTIPHPIRIDRSKLHLYPDARGMQHCEVLSLLELYPRWFPQRWRKSWSEEPRFPDLTLEACHPTVRERLDLPAIHKHGIRQPYRPEPLRGDPALKAFYDR